MPREVFFTWQNFLFWKVFPLASIFFHQQPYKFSSYYLSEGEFHACELHWFNWNLFLPNVLPTDLGGRPPWHRTILGLFQLKHVFNFLNDSSCRSTITWSACVSTWESLQNKKKTTNLEKEIFLTYKNSYIFPQIRTFYLLNCTVGQSSKLWKRDLRLIANSIWPALDELFLLLWPF